MKRGSRRPSRRRPPPQEAAGESAAGAKTTGAGTLHVVATPLGNLGDLTPRAQETLASCAWILCEDTRRTRVLTSHLGLSPRLIRCDDREEERRIPETLARLAAGEDVALVTDAGTPCLSDPGHRLVRAVAEAGFRVSPVAGPSALAAALSVAGLPATTPAVFEGFLPRRRGPRRRLLAALADEPRTLVLFESPHRLADALRDMAEVLGVDRRAVLARELTKLHEEVVHDTLGGLARRFEERPVRGEIALVVEGAERRADEGPEAARLARDVERLVAELGLDERQALERAASEAGLTRRKAARLLREALESDESE